MSIKVIQEQYYKRGDRIIELESSLRDSIKVLEVCLHYLPEGSRGYREASQFIRQQKESENGA